MAKEASLLLRIKTAGAEALDKVRDNLKSVGEIGSAAMAGLTAVLVKSIMEFREQEQATNALTQAMVNNGVYSKELKKNYDDQSKAIQGLTLFAGEQVTQAQAALQMQLGEKQITQELTMAVANLATAKKMDLTSAAELVGKTISGTNNILQKQGVHFDNNTTGAERMTAVVEGLNGAFGGQAAAATSGLGALTKLQNTLNDMFEEIGGRIAPIIEVLGAAFIGMANDGGKASMFVDGMVSSLTFLSKVGVTLTNMFVTLSETIGITLGTAIEAVSAAMEMNFKKALAITKQGVSDAGDAIVKGYENTASTLDAIDAASAQKKVDNQAKEAADLEASLENKKQIAIQKKMETDLALQESEIVAQEQRIAMMDMNELQKAEKEISFLDAAFAKASSHEERMRILKQKSALLDTTENLKKQEMEKKADEERVKNREATLSKIATLQSSNNQLLAVAGKAAALTQIAIETPVAISKALSAFPPPFSFAAAGLVGAAMATQAAQVAGVQLAEGGIVTARPGGIQATIGEGGQDEAVIPLDRAGEFGLGGGGGVTINVYGGMLGDESSAHQFAKVIDQQLLKLRQNNESVAFDGGIV